MFCSVGVPFLLGGSDLPASMGLISLESKSVDPFETRVDPCVGKEIEDLRRALKVLFFMSVSPYCVRILVSWVYIIINFW